MLIGQSVVAPIGGATYYGPWMPRQGDGLTAVFEIIDAMTPFNLVCKVQTKNREDKDSSASLLTGSATFTTATTDHFTTSGAKELVRFQYTLSGDESNDTWIHFRANPIIWQPN